MENAIFSQLAIVLGLSAALGFVTKVFKLPLIVSYLLAGVILSFLRIFNVGDAAALTFLPEIGIAFVLFFVGMELDLNEIKSLGKPIVLAGLGQVLFSVLAGSIIAQSLGIAQTEAIFLGVGLAFSSTIVVVKLLLEKKDLASLYGKLSLGILLLEDLVAILLLMGMSVSSSMFNLGFQENLPLLTLLLKGALLLLLTFGLARYVLTTVFKAVAQSSELLFLSALAWCFIFVEVSLILGFSVVIGAFLAGLALANSPFHYEVQGKVKPLRDFFVTLFFVYLGSQVSFEHLSAALPLIAIFTLYALVAKPIIFLLILGALGFRKHTIFQTALNLSQVSEFSLIIMAVGLKAGLVSETSLTAMAFTGVVSIIFSSVLISSSSYIYSKMRRFLGFFEHGNLIHQAEKKNDILSLDDHVILIGAHRVGGEIVKYFKKEKIPFLVLDFNPKVIQSLMDEKVPAFYGDLGDPEILEFLNLDKSKLIISTAQDLTDNLMLLAEVRRRKLPTVVIARAGSVNEAEQLYAKGANYVILPEIVSGVFITQLLKNHWPSLAFFKDRSEIELNKLSQNHFALE